MTERKRPRRLTRREKIIASLAGFNPPRVDVGGRR